MARIISLQGGMAVGKTTCAAYLEDLLPGIKVSYENPNEVIKEIKRRGLSKEKEEDYYEIQRLFINHELTRWRDCQEEDYVLMDFGPEEVLFHTLFYPRVMGFPWPVERVLKDELEALKACQPEGVLFLEASKEQLARNRQQDPQRTRNSFAFYQENFYPHKKRWLTEEYQVTSLDCCDASLQDQKERVFNWIRNDYIKSMKEKFVVVKPYDLMWPKAFQKLKMIIYPGLEPYCLGIEHVGSTSIPGMVAKPIIDMDIILRDEEDFGKVKGHLERLGYEHTGDQGLPGREAFELVKSTEKTLQAITHHLYVCLPEGKELKKHIRLRDRLTKDSHLRDEYIAIKMKILSKVGYDNRSAYVAMKEANYSSYFDKVYKDNE